MRKILAYAAVAALAPSLASAQSATVPSGIKTEIATHDRFDSQCRTSLVEIRILKAPDNGTVTTEPKDVVVRAVNRRGETQPAQCVGKTVQGVAVFYQSKPGFTGSDSFRYRRFNPNDANDRFNADISYAITVTSPQPPAAAAAQSPAAATAQPSVKTVFEKYNLLGTFSWDCSKPASKDNQYFVNRVVDADHVQRDQMSGETTRDAVTIIDKAAGLGPNELSVSGTREGQPAEGIWRVENNRQIGTEVTIGGKKVISAGRYVGSGRNVQWLVKCSAQ